MLQRVVIVLIVLVALALPFVFPAVIGGGHDGEADVPPVRLRATPTQGGPGG
jgi:hypothetical protein